MCLSAVEGAPHIDQRVARPHSLQTRASACQEHRARTPSMRCHTHLRITLPARPTPQRVPRLMHGRGASSLYPISLRASAPRAGTCWMRLNGPLAWLPHMLDKTAIRDWRRRFPNVWVGPAEIHRVCSQPDSLRALGGTHPGIEEHRAVVMYIVWGICDNYESRSSPPPLPLPFFLPHVPRSPAIDAGSVVRLIDGAGASAWVGSGLAERPRMTTPPKRSPSAVAVYSSPAGEGRRRPSRSPRPQGCSAGY